MIAPLRMSEPLAEGEGRRLHEAHQVIASTFLAAPSEEEDAVRPTRPWKAWLLVGWILVVTGVYFASMTGLL